jgi:uncharacterized protein (TIGR02996 family)
MIVDETMRGAFLRDIVEHPDDDAPRLIYADWLEERGEAERASFIRAKYPPDLVGRDQEVIRWYRYAKDILSGVALKSWQVWPISYPGPENKGASFPAAEGGCAFRCSRPPFVVALRHGFVCAVATYSRQFFKVAARLFASQPVESVVLLDAWPEVDRGTRLWICQPKGWLVACSFLPDSLFSLLPGDVLPARGWPNRPHKTYRNREAAYEALSDACVRYGRSLPLPPGTRTSPYDYPVARRRGGAGRSSTE